MTMADRQLQKTVMRPWSKPQTRMSNHELRDAVFAFFSENRKDLRSELEACPAVIFFFWYSIQAEIKRYI